MSIRHYEGVLGIFDYDDEVFEVKVTVTGSSYLYFINKNGLLNVDLPKGCINTRYMFHRCKLPEGFSLGDNFDTSNVKDMLCMFENCTLPKGFSLGDKFNTSNVEDMRWMFKSCTLPEGFSLGDNFDTNNVKDMHCMFENCTLPEGFSLGNKFGTKNVVSMNGMFCSCTIPKGFSLGDKFNTSNAKDLGYMLSHCTIPKGFSLGDKFDTSNAKNLKGMFYKCSFPKDFDASSFNLETKEGTEDLLKAFNEYSKEYSNKDLEACTKDLVKLLKEGKTIEESKKILIETYVYPIETISSCIVNVTAKFSDKCIRSLESLLIVEPSTSCSKYSIGEVQKNIIRKRVSYRYCKWVYSFIFK